MCFEKFTFLLLAKVVLSLKDIEHNWHQGSILPSFYEQLLRQLIYAELTSIRLRAYSVKVWRNFKFYAQVELGAVLLVKLNSIFLRKTLCVSTFLLCASGLVKLTPEYVDSKICEFRRNVINFLQSHKKTEWKVKKWNRNLIYKAKQVEVTLEIAFGALNIFPVCCYFLSISSFQFWFQSSDL